MAEVESIKEIVDARGGNLENKPVKGNPNGEPTKGRLGGPRPGGGRPPGKLNRKTLEAMKVKEAVNQRIMRNADRLINAQLDLAVGEKVLMVIRTEGEGKNRRRYTEMVTDPEVIKEYIDWNEGLDGAMDPSDDENYYYMTTKPANNQAIDSLMNRAIGKVPDRLEVEGRFVSANEITIKVVGGSNDIIDIGEDGQLVGAEGSGGADNESAPEPSDGPSQSPTSS